jgi:hypothetical protein
MTHVCKQFVQFLNMCYIMIGCIIIARKDAYKVQLHLNWYVWMNVMSHVTEHHVQLVLGNFMNL